MTSSGAKVHWACVICERFGGHWRVNDSLGHLEEVDFSGGLEH